MINLLPPSETKILQNEEKRKMILIIGFLIFIFLLCLIMMLISIKIYISGQITVEDMILSREKEEIGLSKEEDLKDKIREANNAFAEIKSFYDNQFKLTDVINRISETIPEGIFLTILSYQPKEGQVNISGFAEDRETLFEFKKNLEKEEFKEVFFPPYTWIEAKEINFNSHFKIKPDEDKL
jgi:Tfp pilus assembly protein PilN